MMVTTFNDKSGFHFWDFQRMLVTVFNANLDPIILLWIDICLNIYLMQRFYPVLQRVQNFYHYSLRLDYQFSCLPSSDWDWWLYEFYQCFSLWLVFAYVRFQWCVSQLSALSRLITMLMLNQTLLNSLDLKLIVTC